MASRFVPTVHHDLIKVWMSGCDIFGDPDPLARVRLEARNSPDRMEGLYKHELDIDACRSIAMGSALLSGLIMLTAYEMDYEIKVGRTETLATLISDNLKSCLSLGISTELVDKSERLLEKLGPWGEDDDPIWAQPSKNTGLLSRIVETFPDVQIVRAPKSGTWVLFSGDTAQEIAKERDFGHLLSAALTKIKRDPIPRRKRD